MNPEELSQRVKLSCQRALLGAVPRGLRGLTIDYNEKWISWRGYFENEPTEEETDVLSTALSEVIADFPSIEKSNEEYLLVPYPNKIFPLKEWIFLRWEEQQFE